VEETSVKLSVSKSDPVEALKSLRGSVRRYDNPMEPVGEEDSEALGMRTLPIVPPAPRF
jgi:hypothetical protein